MLVIWLIVAISFCGAMVVWVLVFGALFHDLWLMESWRTLVYKVYARRRRNIQQSLSRGVYSQNVSPHPVRRSLTEEEQRTIQRQRLLMLLHNDTEVLDGLMLSVRKQYPTKSQLWHLEKVLCDLERDRFR